MVQTLIKALARPAAPLLALAAILVFALAYAATAPAAELFGRIHFDDGVFFAGGKALAEGKGFVIPNLPGEPPQTKHPVLYPWLLSLVWRAAPEFPRNVEASVWLSALSFCAFLALSFFYLKRQPGVGDWTALGCIALTATNAQLLDLSSSLMSEPLFMALAAGTLLAADEGIKKRSFAWMAGAGALAGLAFLTRTAGVAFLAGVAGWALWRRETRKALAFAAASAPLVLGHLWWRASVAVPPPPPEAGRGWVQVWTYFTSYPGFWKLSVPSFDVFASMVGANFTKLLTTPGTAATFTPPEGFFGNLVGVALTLGVLSGLARLGRRTGLTAAHLSLAVSALIAALWNFPIVPRMLAVFTPLFCLGAWVEARHVAGMLSSLRSKQPAFDRLVTAAFAAALLAAGVFTVRAHTLAPLRQRRAVQALAATFAAQDEAASWIGANAAPGDVILAFSDSRIYLETGRQSSWPAAYTTDILYAGEEALDRQFDDYFDTARRLGARYWIVTPDELAADTPTGRRRLAELEAMFPLVFRSTNGAVRIRDLSSQDAVSMR